MPQVRRVHNVREAEELATLLNSNTRRRVVVVVGVPADHDEPLIDAEYIAQNAGDFADVYVLPTGDVSWAFAKQMPTDTQVYGSAARVYPLGLDWVKNLKKSPLRFAHNERRAAETAEELISDALAMALSAGLLKQVPKNLLRPAEGTVKGMVAGRALVEIGGRMPASVADDLTVEGVPIERILREGQKVSGEFNRESNRLDVRGSLRPAEDALAHYEPGSVVLAEVAKVRNGKAELVLYPKTENPAIVVPVLRADVTSNELDDLRTLMTVGEVVNVRVVELGPTWKLTLHDVDDDEAVLEAPSLLPDGPPWLVEETFMLESLGSPIVSEELVSLPSFPEFTTEAPGQPSKSAATTEPTEVGPEPEVAPAPFIPSPLLLDRNRPKTTKIVPSPQPAAVEDKAESAPRTGNTKQLLQKIDGLGGELNVAKKEIEKLKQKEAYAQNEIDFLSSMVEKLEAEKRQLEAERMNYRARLRKASNKSSTSAPTETPVFADPEQGFRHLVTERWAIRTNVAEQASRRLSEHTFGPEFFTSLENLQGITKEKVADTVFEIVTGLATSINGREVHQLRTGVGGADPVRVRDRDGAVAWRASLQVKTASARRIHYWMLADGSFEFAKVVTHDDFTI